MGRVIRGKISAYPLVRYPDPLHGAICSKNPNLSSYNKTVKKAFYLSVNVFSTKALIGDTIFTSPTGDRTAILRGHPSHAKV